MSYDRALTVFSPDGHLFQVDYAQEAVRRGTCAIGVKGKDSVVLAVERKAVLKLQDARTVRKTALLDEHICLAFAGLSADARVIIDRAQYEAQSHRLVVEDPASVEYITKVIGGLKQHYTQRGGTRPFGVSCLIIGFNEAEPDKPYLYMTEPSGIYSAWKATAIGRSSNTVRDFLDQHWKEGLSKHETIKLAVKGLLEIVQTGEKNMELTVCDGFGNITYMTQEQLASIVKEIHQEREDEAERKKNRLTVASNVRDDLLTGGSN